MASLTALIIVPIGGYLADFYGRVKLIASSFYFRSVSFLIYALSGSWPSLAIGKFAEGLTQYNHAAQTAIMADSMRPGRRAVGFAAVNTLPRMVTMIAPTVGAYIITTFGLEIGMRYLLFVGFVSMFFVGFCRQKFLKETLSTKNSEQIPQSKNVLNLIVEAYKSSWNAMKWTPKNVVIFVLMGAFSSFSGAMIGPFWIIYATQIIRLTELNWGLILFLEGLSSLLVSIPAGMLVDRLGNRRMIVAMLFLSLFPGIVFVFSRTLIQTAGAMVALTVFSSFLIPASHAWLADAVPRTLRARIASAYGRGVIGVRGGAGGLGSGYVLMIPAWLGSLAGGVIYSINPAFPWFIHTGSLSVCLILGIFFLKDPKIAEI
jgi:MFS family permease